MSNVSTMGGYSGHSGHPRRRVVTMARSGVLGLASIALAFGPSAVRAATTGPTTPVVDVTADVVYAHLSGVDLKLDVYAPTGATQLPAVLVIHGGYWKVGDKADWVNEATVLAQNGTVAFVADYRLDCSPKAPPSGVDPALCGYHATAPVQDLQQAIRWIRVNASAYGALGTEVGAFGGSAGGNLALMLGALGTPGDDQPDAVASWSGNTEVWRYDLFRNADSARHIGQRYVGCPFEGTGSCPDDWYAASPLPQVGPSEVPTYVANSTHETIPLQLAQDMDDALANEGVPVTLRVLRGTMHERAYENVEVSPGVTVFDETMAFLTTYLG
jgi:acetyl esterase